MKRYRNGISKADNCQVYGTPIVSRVEINGLFPVVGSAPLLRFGPRAGLLHSKLSYCIEPPVIIDRLFNI